MKGERLLAHVTQAKREIVEVGRELYEKGLLVGTDGNISIRLGEDDILITGSGFCKGKLKEEDITLVSLGGDIKEGPRPARDIRMHLAVYREKEEAKAVVHAHPPVITGYSMSDMSFERLALPEVMFSLRGIAVTKYATPISVEVARGVTDALRRNPIAQCVLLANHGALTYGNDVYDSFYKMETLELFARSNLVSQMVGNTRYLDQGQMGVLNRLLSGTSPDEIVPPGEDGY